MKRTLVVVAVVLGYATAASAAATLLVSVRDSSFALKNTPFADGETIVLQVDGNSGGGTTIGIQGYLSYSGAITNYTTSTQTSMYGNADNLVLLSSDGLGAFMGQNNGTANPSAPSSPDILARVFLKADGTTGGGSSLVSFGGEVLSFFDIYYSPGSGAPATGASFTVLPVPEPATAALIGLGLLGLALGGRRRA